MSERVVEIDAPPSWWRVTFTHGSIVTPKRAMRRFRCDGHLADRQHHIEIGDLYVRTSLPPNHPEINNDGWWHMRFCLACCPEKHSLTSPEPSAS